MKVTRRQFLALAGTAGAAVAADAFGYEAHRVLVSRHDVRVPGLASELNGIRLAQVSDVHFPGNQIAARVALEHLHRERPEIVVLTGDMTETALALDDVRTFAAEARGSLDTVALLGNWEHRAGVATSMAAGTYRSAGIQLLVNQSRTVDVGGVPLTLVGLNDGVVGEIDLPVARRDVVAGATEIWLVHSPGFAEHPPAGVAARPAMVIAGHTHGGQIRIPLLPAVKPTGAGRFLEGWYHDTFAPMYVSRGVGTTGIPARFRCPAELPIFTLRAA
ncbi:MAG TPA: metallophosphoesterase family protein [Gemmatimonadales bacterium]|nr:metallophosphoesterase family protein [Gemmatimonadales bacterium]